MPFNIDQVVSALYSTVLNPWLAILIPAGLVYRDPSNFKLIPRTSDRQILSEISLTPELKKALCYVLSVFVIRLNDLLSRRALNNGESDIFDWDKEVVVVTGGAGGIGGELVKQLSSKGTKVAVLDVQGLTYAKPSSVEYFKCDLTNEESLQQAASSVRAKWGNPTVVCCVAGIVRGKTLFEATKRDLDLTFGVNTIGLALCYKEFVPAMAKANHGHVVTISSQTAYSSIPGMVDYAASKAAALALHEGLQTELKHVYNAPKVRCTVVLPSIVRTKMFTGLVSPSEFIAPVLTPQGVAGAIAQALWAGEGRHIELPWLNSKLGPFTRAFPSWMRVGIQDSSRHIMKSFSGHKVMD